MQKYDISFFFTNLAQIIGGMNKKRFVIPVYIYFIIAGLLILFFFPREGKFRYSFVEGRPWQYGLLIAPFDFPVYKTDAALKNEQDSVQAQSFPNIQKNDETANLQNPDTTALQKQTPDDSLQENLRKISPVAGMVQAGEKIVDRGEIISESVYNILRSLKINYDEQAGTLKRQAGLWTGTLILIGGIITCYFFYFYYFRKRIYAKRKDIVFHLFILTFFTLLTEFCVTYNLFSVYIIPFAIIPITVRTFFDSRTAQMTHLVTIFICSLLIPLSFEFVLMQLIVCWVALFVLKDLSKRSELMKCALYIFVAYILVYFGLLLFQEGNFSKTNELMLLYFGINFLFVLFTYSFIYILEKVFGYISDVTLVELSDINIPILRQLAESCPGSFQHSLQVSMLGVAAATKVNANPQLIRTGALYHDLGKMKNPNFFIENKIEGNDPHENLTYEQSARIITSHVTEGVKIAEKNKIPEAIIKFIRTHHGKGKAKYFYNSFRNKFPDAEIDEAAFSYLGDNPDTVETAILMMADSVEAASRSLKDYSEESIRSLVNRIINTQINEGLLSNAPLTFKDISDIKNVFVERLLSVYHARIVYPELEKK